MTRPNNNQQKVRSCRTASFSVSAEPRVKLKKREKKNKFLDLARELKNCDCFNNCTRCSWYSHQRNGEITIVLGNKRTSGDNPNDSIGDIGQET